MRELQRLLRTSVFPSAVFASGGNVLRLPRLVEAYLELDRRTIASLSQRKRVVFR
jgi:hypothetical protein